MSTDDELFTPDEVLGGFSAKRARLLLFQIESRPLLKPSVQWSRPGSLYPTYLEFREKCWLTMAKAIAFELLTRAARDCLSYMLPTVPIHLPELMIELSPTLSLLSPPFIVGDQASIA